ncbi:glucosaminidase domain-containing protein [Patescibacteria group bacterium]|nr:glucosaminidase domain-containing protein [Patescibacteria group bacterium]
MRYSQEVSSLIAGLFLIFSLTTLLMVVYWQDNPAYSRQSVETQEVLGTTTQVDPRITSLENFLEKHKSPLASLTETFIEVADEYELDWRLLPAIAGKESSYGKVIPLDKQDGTLSYNAWGWGVYGDKALAFSSWEEGVGKVGEGLRNGYIDKGLLTPKEIMRRYTPRSDGSWARDVSFIMEQISLGEK